MRDLLVLAIVFGSLPVAFARPWIGVLVFAWISYMNPHRYTWGIAYDFPVAMLVAAATLAGLVFTRDRQSIPWRRETLLIAALWAVFTFTTFFALNEQAAWAQWQKVSKILLMTFVTLVLINAAEKLRYLLLTIALSVGAIGVKGGLWVLITGGAHRVYGPPRSFMAGNNDLGLALAMTLPMLLYLARGERRRWLRLALRGTFVLTALACVFTYSRGAFLSLLVAAFLMLVEARRKTLAALLIGAGVLAVVWIVPAHWTARMDTIGQYELDQSAQGRLNAWRLAWNVALARPFTGGGFETFVPHVFDRYAPEVNDAREVHSIYFEALGEHGFPGLILFLALLGSCLLTLSSLKRRFAREDRFFDLRHYPTMLRMSILVYMTGGLFLGKAYFDFFYHLVAAVILLKTLAARVPADSPQAAPAPALALAKTGPRARSASAATQVK